MNQEFIKEMAKIVLSSTVLVTIVNAVIQGFRDKKKAKTGINKAVQLILLGELKRQGKEHIKEGNITLEELNEFNEKYKVYKEDMSGNGYAEAVHKKVNSLPIALED